VSDTPWDPDGINIPIVVLLSAPDGDVVLTSKYEDAPRGRYKFARDILSKEWASEETKKYYQVQFHRNLLS
jgi:hypothetical protein